MNLVRKIYVGTKMLKISALNEELSEDSSGSDEFQSIPTKETEVRVCYF